MILGIDLSLTSTGLAIWRDRKLELDTIHTPDLRGKQRWAAICGRIWGLVGEGAKEGGGPLVVLEGPVLAANSGVDTVFDMAGLRGVLEYSLWSWATVSMVVPPSNLKKYATGNGRASKEEVVKHVDRWVQRYEHVPEPDDNDQADALVLTAMALDQYDSPLVDVPQLNRSALSAGKNPLIWPVWSNPDPVVRRAEQSEVPF